MKKILGLLIAAFVILMIPGKAQAQELTAGEIVEKANLASYYAGQDGLADVRMTIKDAQGRVRSRQFRIMRLTIEKGGEQKFYVYFNEPADVAGTAYMVWKHPGRDDDRWLYLPALDLVRRIAAGDKRSSFVGSHFVYEDVSGRGIQDDTHELTEATDTSYKLKNIPKDPKGVEFSYYYVWIDKANFMPTKAEYYNSKDQLMRTIEAVEISDIQGYPTVVKSRVKDFERGGETEMEFSHIRYDIGLTQDIFEERYLRKAPAQWIK